MGFLGAVVPAEGRVAWESGGGIHAVGNEEGWQRRFGMFQQLYLEKFTENITPNALD